MRKVVSRLLTVGLLAIVFAGSAIHAQDTNGITFEAPPSAPGSLIDVGGYRLHLYCTGAGGQDAPTVILEPGFARFSLNMRALQEVLAGDARVCAYDHAGFGWSDPAPADVPRTTRQLSDELYTLLEQSGESAPYILVAHSLGGFVAHLFAAQHADQVAGLILLDATPPEFLLGGTTAQTDQALEFILQSTVPIAQSGEWSPQSLMPVLTLTNDVSADLRPAFIALATRAPYVEAALAEWQNRQANAQAVIDSGDLGDLPMTVLSAGDRLALSSDADGEWVRDQAAQAGLSARGELDFVIGGSHEFYIDQPQVVARALYRMLDER